MQYRNLGGSGLKVSEISLGSWISCHDSNNMDIPRQIIEKALSCGINFFDTSNAYHKGNAEEILGTVLSEHPRDSYVIATKVYFPQGEAPNLRGLSRKHIFAEVEKSLKRLRTDHIDLYYCHWYDKETPIEETLRAMDDLVKKGAVLYYGVSNWTAAQIAYGLRVIDRYGLYKITANQPSYNMLDRYIENESIPLCVREGIGQVVYSPLAQGALTGKYRRSAAYPEGSRAVNPLYTAEVTIFDYLTDEMLETIENLNKIAVSAGLALADMAIAWTLRLPAVSSALIGASKPEQVVQNANASDIKLSSDILDEIDKVLSESRHSVKHNIISW